MISIPRKQTPESSIDSQFAVPNFFLVDLRSLTNINNTVVALEGDLPNGDIVIDICVVYQNHASNCNNSATYSLYSYLRDQEIIGQVKT